MATCQITDDSILIETDCYTAAIATKGYVSGVKEGTFRDRKTGAVELGYGLDIADFLLEPQGSKSQDPQFPYHHGEGDPTHGRIAKRFVELPQICTQARSLPFKVFRGENFVAIRQWYCWTQATQGYRAGSRWEQTLVFQDGLRHFYSSDRITSVNAVNCLVFRLDFPGHVRHQRGDSFSAVYLSYHGEIGPEAFHEVFPPDRQFLYRRNPKAIPSHLIRAYRTKLHGKPGPWLGGIAMDPADVYEAWCLQREFVCFITEIGGRPVKAGQSFGAAYAIGWFDRIEDMHALAERLTARQGIEVWGDEHTATWKWIAATSRGA